MDKEKYNGKIIEQMPLLITAGLVPVTFQDELERRIIALKSGDEKLIERICERICDTGDMIFTGTDGSIKIQLESELAKKINPQILLYEGGMKITEKEYKNLEGCIHLRKGTFEHMLKGDYFTENEVLAKDEQTKRNILRLISRNNEDLLSEYFRRSIKYVNGKGYITKKLMGLQIKTKTDMPVGYLISMEEITTYGSPVYASHKFTDMGGRLTGKKPTLHQQ